MRKSGSEFLRAIITTSSEGGIPGLMVQSQEPKLDQTRGRRSRGNALKDPLRDQSGLDEAMVGGEFAPDGIAVRLVLRWRY